MRTILRRMLVAAGCVGLLLAVVLGIGIYRLSIDLRAMTPLQTKEIVPGVFSILDSNVNLYLARGAGGYVAFDSGNSAKSVQTEMAKLAIAPADVLAVFLTHADSDHVGGLPLFPRAAVYLSVEEEQMIDGRTARFFMFKNHLAFRHTSLSDGETVSVGGLNVKTILTPGHTPGSACYLVDGQYLFVGDSLSLRSGKAGLFSRVINMDNAAQERSLRKLAKLDGIKGLFTAHFGWSESFDKAMADYR